MAVDATDLLAPTGDLLPEFFPGEATGTTHDRLNAYLAEGLSLAASVADEPTRERAARQWAYHRAYGAIYVRLAHAPASVTVRDEVTTQRLNAQIRAFEQLSVQALASYQTIVTQATAPAATGPDRLTSDTTALGFSW